MNPPHKENDGTITQLIPGVFVIPGVTNVGVVEDSSKSELYLIDTGRTEEQGEKLFATLQKYFGPLEQDAKDQKYKIKAIINTHAHADHTGADALIQKKTGCHLRWLQFPQSGSYTVSCPHRKEHSTGELSPVQTNTSG